jgi:SAM-dependent methyltransferase
MTLACVKSIFNGPRPSVPHNRRSAVHVYCGKGVDHHLAALEKAQGQGPSGTDEIPRPVPALVARSVAGARRMLKSFSFRDRFPNAAAALDVLDNYVTDPYRTPEWFEERYSSEVDFWHYARNTSARARHRLALEILGELSAGRRFERVLEIGCAEGIFTEMVAPLCKSLLALDFSPTALERARRRCAWPEQFEFREWNLRTDPVPRGFDLILVMDVLFCFRRPAGLRAICEKIAAAMRPGDYLMVGDTREEEFFETTWWGRRFLRGGKWVVRTAQRSPVLATVREVVSETHVYGLFRKIQ